MPPEVLIVIILLMLVGIVIYPREPQPTLKDPKTGEEIRFATDKEFEESNTMPQMDWSNRVTLDTDGDEVVRLGWNNYVKVKTLGCICNSSLPRNTECPYHFPKTL